jgi:DNA-binding SARP family transcriptional activator
MALHVDTPYAGDAAPAAVSIAVLGPVMADSEGQWTRPPTRQVGRVLAALAGWPGEIVDREVLASALWGEVPPQTVRNTLQVHISHLRRWLGKDVVDHVADGYVLQKDESDVDAARFESLIRLSIDKRRVGCLSEAMSAAQEALALVRGPAYPDIRDPDLVARRARIAELAEQAREDVLSWQLDLATDERDIAGVVAGARELVARFPLRESGHALLMRALFCAQRPGEAEQAFADAEALLSTCPGLVPGAALVATRQRCRDRDAALLPPAMRPARA